MTTLIGYEWRLREQMAVAGMFSTTKLIPLLEERGVHLSSSQVYRLVAERPERLNLQVLVVLMDILNCTADDLIVRADLGHARSTATAEAAGTDSASTVIRTRGLRPQRARLAD
ncbi:helix-turn-helix domain-containing protein [Marisediminicola senii]|uniref:helix-turn-helix domain-containing protein n=1 Tax=Marisediminicola senii TaxID=2711233 RepID=UPI0013ECE030|nr:helix-turn-helix transcriptional regulator [Marisediminicola senii]